MGTYGEVGVWLCSLLTLVVGGGRWSAAYRGCFSPSEEPLVHVDYETR
jgi:hypothetical protein